MQHIAGAHLLPVQQLAWQTHHVRKTARLLPLASVYGRIFPNALCVRPGRQVGLHGHGEAASCAISQALLIMYLGRLHVLNTRPAHLR
eukprot:350255-Chlamydomonas_euryale.AAC.7